MNGGTGGRGGRGVVVYGGRSLQPQRRRSIHHMSSRKLQQEFDKLQKKVSEGLQQFDDIYDKVALTENANQKEKLEGDLRKEIKKLQRSRDQVKQWLGDGSNKLDKALLQDIRGRIENAMERFKELEKVSKMKQFSNEGLELQAKLGARGLDEAKKIEATRYITEVLEELNRQNELLSGELSQLNHKKRLGSVQTAIDEVAEKMERNNFHIGKLELVLRNLDNDQLEPERIEEIRDDLDYYVENNQLDDFVEYNEFYDVLDLDESLEVVTPFPAAPEEPTSPKKADKTDKSDKSASATPLPIPVALQAAPASRAPPPGLHLKPGSPAPAPVVRSAGEELKKRALTAAAAAVTAAPAAAPAAVTPTAPTTPVRVPSAASADNSAVPLRTPLPVVNNDNKTFWDTVPRLAQLAHTRLQNPLPFAAISQMLETSLLNCPDSFDLEKPRHYNPVNVHPLLVDYPQEPMYELNGAGVMRKFDTDTLFFCFYYSEGQDNLAKWNAARELSARGWVFHKDTKQWFSKDKPRARAAVGDDGDNGSYKYFDYQSSWLIRRKDKFDFGADVRQTF